MQKSSSAPGQLGFFAGVLDEVRIWNYARAQSDIQFGMSRPIETASGLVAVGAR